MLFSLVGHSRPAVRSFRKLRFQSTKAYDPLRILYCGSDDFSISSLQALRNLQDAKPEKIASIDVVCRPDKRVGRGLKTVHAVPIKHAADRLGLPLHQIDTFTGWTPPGPYNLVVAVSFGLLVPSRILSAAKYGGLNLHPSLLPDLRGPAPIVHTLLKRRSQYGVTLQTMHPKHFDQGAILSQQVGGDVPQGCSASQLIELAGRIGAPMLANGVRDGIFVPPLESVRGSENGIIQQLEHAPKITPLDRQIAWTTWTADEFVLRGQVLGDLWDHETYCHCTGEQGNLNDWKRVTFSGSWEKLECLPSQGDLAPGTPILLGRNRLGFATVDGEAVAPESATVSGGKRGTGLQVLVQKLKGQSKQVASRP
ncbi:Formyltransferase [Polychaeton citri CBS 116435]|uniref:methionyl-tRNA formyltransferase n=1 Tax=Polychaeton citri CBS 116435 TaxID=1314669 RepID=A0A9P4Q7N5_9PEZI|nr:Formyltransferase [Polychaeton citri CBS 116435]